MSVEPLRILIVDDEAPARMRIQNLLGDLASEQPMEIVGIAGNGGEALDCLTRIPADLALVDIRMPGMDGIEFARRAALLPDPPHVVFVTAYDDYALKAFDLAAADYLLKPVRAARLAQALDKVRSSRMKSGPSAVESAKGPRTHLRVVERGRITLLPVDEVLFFRADSKYTVAHTQDREFLLEEPLSQLETEFPNRFARIHRSCLVAIHAIQAFEQRRSPESRVDDVGWDVRLAGLDVALPVSRRQWPSLKRLLG